MNNKSERSKTAFRVTWIGIIWNIVLIVIKLIAGVLGRSGALIADGLHSISDFASDIAVLAGLRLSDKPRDTTHNYGHGKFETLSTLSISILLFFVAAGIAANSAVALNDALAGSYPEAPQLVALFAAFVSIVVKEGLFQYTIKAGRKINSQAMIANAWHHRSDSFTSIAVLVGIGGAIVLGRNWTILDPIAALLVSVFIFKFSLSTFRESIDELLEASLGEELQNNIMKLTSGVSGAYKPHNIKTRKIGNNIAIDMHIKVDPKISITEAHDIASLVEERLQETYGVDTFISIHVEPDAQLKPAST